MPRARTGTLIYKRTTGWNARVWVDVKDETTAEIREERRWIPLGTHDRDLAKRKMAKVVAMLAAGEIVADEMPKEAARKETVREYAKNWLADRKAIGVVMAA